MAYLLYGITKHPVVNEETMTGMKGREISFVTGHGLCAAVSEMSAEDRTPPVAELLTYSRVVEDLHRLQAVVPLRYGCFLNGIPFIREALKDRQRQYQALLEKLEGQVEMGIRILLPDRAMVSAQEKQPANGQDYLTQRKTHYRIREEISGRHQRLLESTLQAFSGLYGDHRSEAASKNGSVILSLYFLMPENKVSLFRETFRRLAEDGEAKALISGPWPPYNFVATDLAPAENPV